MEINLRTLYLPKTYRMTVSDYKTKVLEELLEFVEEINTERDLDALAAEYMDVVQSGLNYLEALKIDVKYANEKHIEKLLNRGIVIDDSSISKSLL